MCLLVVVQAYQYRYDAPGGSAGLVESVRKRLEAAKLPVPVKTEKRGFDHGVFVPLLLARPEADIPIVTVSLEVRSLCVPECGGRHELIVCVRACVGV